MAKVILKHAFNSSYLGGQYLRPSRYPQFVPDSDIPYLPSNSVVVGEGGEAPEVSFDAVNTLRDFDEVRKMEEAVEEVKTIEKKGPGRPRKVK